LAATGYVHAVDAPSFSKDVQPLLDTYCRTCHSGSRPKEGVRVEDYRDLFRGRRKLVTPGDDDGSRLIKMMLGQSGKKMPPRSSERQPSDKEIKLIKEWIKAGAKDDSDAGSGSGSGSTKGSGSGSGSASAKGSGSESEREGRGREREREKGRREREEKDDDR
jgi:hypothetical protein